MEKINYEAMIKPEELRIGNLVRVSIDNRAVPKGELCEVVEINSQLILGKKKGSVILRPLNKEMQESPYGVWCNDIEGIPITLDFLEKNNFEKKEYNTDEGSIEWHVYKHEDSCVEVLYYPQTDEIFVFYCNKRPCNIAYVHELQNFLAAVKENIKITV